MILDEFIDALGIASDNGATAFAFYDASGQAWEVDEADEGGIDYQGGGVAPVAIKIKKAEW